MTVAVKVFFICCLLQGSSCQQWAVFLPQTLQGLSGSCLRVPCSFTLLTDYEDRLDGTCKAIWKRGWNTEVFDSSLTGDDASRNFVQGNLTGNLQEKDCTTVFNNMGVGDSESYSFRLECNNALKFNFNSPRARITIQNSLPKPKITPSSLEVEEGDPVRLNCSTLAPCPVLPPTLTWTPAIGDTEESTGTKMTSVMNFTASDLHDGQKFVCSAVYRRQTASSDFESEKSLTLRVLYPPKNTSVSYSGPVREESSVTLTCSANANPAVDSYTWYKVDGDQVKSVGSGNTLSTTVSEEDRQFYCTATNRYGTQKSSVTEIDVQFPPREPIVTVEPEGPVLEGSSVTLHCQSRANPPITNYTWYKGDEEDNESGASLVIHAINPSYNGDYHCSAKNDLGEETSASIQLDVQYPPKNTSVSADPPGPVPDGSSVTLTCTSVANPAAVNISWVREMSGGQMELVGSERDFTFNVTKLSEDQYKCEAKNIHGAQYSEPADIDVTFAPEFLTPFRCVKILSGIRCNCDSQGNPTPSLVWELAGEKVNNSAAVPIREVPLGGVSMRSLITLFHLGEDMPSLTCLSFNSLGSDRFEFNLTASETDLGTFSDLLDPKSVGVGFVVGLLGMLLVCVPLLLFFRKRRGSHSPDKGAVDTSDCLVTNETNSSMVQAIYENKAVLKDEGRVGDESLHYANVDFIKLQAKSEGKPGEGEIRGLDSKTSEYSEIRLCPRLNNGGDAKKEETPADTFLGRGDDTVGLIGPNGEKATA